MTASGREEPLAAVAEPDRGRAFTPHPEALRSPRRERMAMDKSAISNLILDRLTAAWPRLAQQYGTGGPAHCVLDDLLPIDLARQIHEAFPDPSTMMLRRSLREVKYVTAQMDLCRPLIESVVFAFQDPRIVHLLGRITGLRGLEPDARLYAGGISLMGRGHFLNPHLDNSHDLNRERYRVLNLLYYVSPDWQQDDGGHLELWPDGPEGRPVLIPCRFNRLVIMRTDRRSWHSVSRVRAEKPRCCVSNYYFSRSSPGEEDYFHVTTFRGRPEQPVRDLLLRADAALRTALRRIRKDGLLATRHYYRTRSLDTGPGETAGLEASRAEGDTK